MVVLATAAAVVASQALITACFSLTQQLVHLGYIPRVRIVHRSHRIAGQIYVPQVNTFLMIACISLVLIFRDSSALAAAYGLAVVGTMGVTTVLFYFVARWVLHWSRWSAGALAGLFLIIEAALMGANLMKLAHGAWIPLVIGSIFYLFMSTWRRGRELLTANLDSEAALPDRVAGGRPRRQQAAPRARYRGLHDPRRAWSAAGAAAPHQAQPRSAPSGDPADGRDADRPRGVRRSIASRCRTWARGSSA